MSGPDATARELAAFALQQVVVRLGCRLEGAADGVSISTGLARQIVHAAERGAALLSDDAPDAAPEHGHFAEMPEGADPLDTPEARDAVRRVLWDLGPIEADRDDIDALVPHALHALAPFVAAANRAAWRAGVEAAAGVCERSADANHRRTANGRDAHLLMGRGDGQIMAANAIRALPPPAGFAVPVPSPIAGRPTDADLLWLCRHSGHSLAMVEIEGVFVPVIHDERGSGPVIPGEVPRG